MGQQNICQVHSLASLILGRIEPLHALIQCTYLQGNGTTQSVAVNCNDLYYESNLEFEILIIVAHAFIQFKF